VRHAVTGRNSQRGERTPLLRREGEYWTIAYGAAVVRLKDAKGLRYLESLLRHPGRSFHVAELFRWRVLRTDARRQLRTQPRRPWSVPARR